MNEKNTKGSPNNVAKDSYKTIKNGKENGLKNMLATQMMALIISKNRDKNIKTDDNMKYILSSNLMMCSIPLYYNLKNNEKRTVRLPFPNMEDSIKNLKEFQKNKK